MGCEICGKPVLFHSKYCPFCSHAMNVAPSEFTARKNALMQSFSRDLNGFTDWYTKTLIDELDWHKPLSMWFDHRIPNDPKTLVVTFRINNQSKGDMTDVEFTTMMDRLDLHFRGQEPFTLDGLEFAYWNRKPRFIAPKPVPLKVPRRYVHKIDHCKLCGKQIPAVFTLCARCRRLVPYREKRAGLLALMEAYDKATDTIRCQITNLPVEEVDYNSPRYISYDHKFPGQKGNVQVTMLIINLMKTQLSADEYPLFVKEFAACRREGRPFNKKRVPFKYWRR